MGLVGAPLLHDTTWEQAMAGDFGNGRTVDDDFVCGDAHRQRLANESPGDRVVVLLIADAALDIGDPVDDLGRVVRVGRQGNQVRSLLGITVDGPLFGLAVQTRTSATLLNHQAVTSLRWARLRKVRPLSKFFSTKSNLFSTLPLVWAVN